MLWPLGIGIIAIPRLLGVIVLKSLDDSLRHNHLKNYVTFGTNLKRNYNFPPDLTIAVHFHKRNISAHF